MRELTEAESLAAEKLAKMELNRQVSGDGPDPVGLLSRFPEQTFSTDERGVPQLKVVRIPLEGFE